MIDETAPSPENAAQANAQPEFGPLLPPIAGFWRRFFAWVIDSLLLGLVGQVIGLLFAAFLFKIGPYGRPIGLLVILPYFGILNSRIGGGQTIGKWLMKIAVRNQRNEPIELWRSFLRILLLALPAFLNGWPVPAMQNVVVGWLVSMLIFGLGGALLYTMVFNRKARQGIHDLILGTYVVYLPGKPVEAFPTTARVHWVVSGIWLGLVAAGTLALTAFAPTLIAQSPLSSTLSLYEVLQQDTRFFSAGVNQQTFYGSAGKVGRSLIITVWYKGKLAGDERGEVIKGIAKTAFEHEKNLDQYDSMQIKITSAYDIGIASMNFSQAFSKTIADWRKELYLNGPPTGRVPGAFIKFAQPGAAGN